MRIKSIQIVEHDKPIPVYDMTVEEHHNFAVNDGIIVHNCANYHHGDSSLNAAISAMTQEFKNNAPLLKGEGSFGSRAVPVAAAARYTFVKLSKAYETYFVDTDIAPESIDPEDPEPEYYLPLIPWILVNGIKGIAVGFATEIQPRSIEQITKICKEYLSGKNIDNISIPPHYPFFNGTFEERDDGVWECVGTFNRSGKTLNITEIPVDFDREKYIKILDKLQDDSQIVRYSEPKSKNKGFNFKITLSNKTKTDDISIEKMFKLRKSLNENLTVIDEDGNLKIFDKAIDIIKHFCDFRLKQYPVRYKKLINKATEDIRFKKEKIRFIDNVNNKEIDMKQPLKKIKIMAKSMHYNDADAQKLFQIPVYHLSQDKIDELGFDIADLENDIKEYEMVSWDKQFMKELDAL